MKLSNIQKIHLFQPDFLTNFFGYLKDKVYKTKPQDLAELRFRIRKLSLYLQMS